MMRGRPRILLIGGTYRALCVLEHLIERGERVAAFIAQEGGEERDFCSEILEICDRASIPARSGRKLGEELVRWLEDRIRPELAIAVGVAGEIPFALGGNCRLGLLEVRDRLQSDACPGVVIRQRGQDLMQRELPALEDGDPDEVYLEVVEHTIEMLDAHLDGLERAWAGPRTRVGFEAELPGSASLEDVSARPDAGSETQRLEAELADYLGADAVLALGSPEEAFRMLFSALGLARGAEVLCPPLVSVAAVDALRRVGAQPIWADVEPDRLTLDAGHLEEALSPRTRAVLLAHAFGQPAALDALYAFAATHELEVLEDAGAALGARFGESRLGRSPCACVFRVPTAATLVPSGVFVSLPATLVERLEKSRPCRLGDGAAALARQALQRQEARLAALRQRAAHYSAELVRYDAFRIPPTPEEALPAYTQYLLRVTRFARTSASDLSKLLAECGIETRRPGVAITARELAEHPIAEEAVETGLLLPLGPRLSEAEQERVLEAIFDFAIG